MKSFLLNLIKLSVIFLISVTLLLPKALAQNECAKLLKDNGQVTSEFEIIDEATIEKEVQIIWYPNSVYLGVTHTELIVEGTLWDGFLGYKVVGDSKKRERSGNRGGRGYLSFYLKVTDSEFQKIQSYLEENKDKLKLLQNCMSGACKAITKNSGVVIPFPFSKVPTLAATYLTLMKSLGYARITKIEWVGKRNLSKFLSFQPFSELIMVYQFIKVSEPTLALLISGFDHAQNYIQNLIPIFSSKGLGQNKETNLSLYACNGFFVDPSIRTLVR